MFKICSSFGDSRRQPLVLGAQLPVIPPGIVRAPEKPSVIRSLNFEVGAKPFVLGAQLAFNVAGLDGSGRARRGPCPCTRRGETVARPDRRTRGSSQKRDLGDPSPALLDGCNCLKTRSLNDPRQGSLWGATGTGGCRESVPRVKRRKRCNGFLAIRRSP